MADVTARKPLRWLDIGGGREIPDCDQCLQQLRTPGLVEACASVGIEHGKTTDQMLREFLDQFHAARHKETAR